MHDACPRHAAPPPKIWGVEVGVRVSPDAAQQATLQLSHVVRHTMAPACSCRHMTPARRSAELGDHTKATSRARPRLLSLSPSTSCMCIAPEKRHPPSRRLSSRGAAVEDAKAGTGPSSSQLVRSSAVSAGKAPAALQSVSMLVAVTSESKHVTQPDLWCRETHAQSMKAARQWFLCSSGSSCTCL